mgnify:CR=1 FL=1
MKRIILIALSLISVNCSTKKSDDYIERVNDIYFTGEKFYSPTRGYYDVVVMDGCEYIDGQNRLTHKGNCSNPIHIRN